MNKLKVPKGYRVRLGTPLGNGRYAAHIVAPNGFYWSPDVHSREEAVQLAIDADKVRKYHDRAMGKEE